MQLVGVTAMLLAAKYEEIWAPEVRDFVYISDKAYNRQQILDMVRSLPPRSTSVITHCSLIRACMAVRRRVRTFAVVPQGGGLGSKQGA